MKNHSSRKIRFHPEYVKSMKNLAQLLTGSTPNFKQDILDDLAKSSYEFAQYFEKWSKVDMAILTAKQKRDHVLKILSKFVYYFLKTKTNKPIDFIIKGISKVLQTPDSEGILEKKTKLRMYVNYASNIAEQIVNSNKENEIRKYFSNASMTDMIVVSQQAYEIPAKSEILLKEYRIITKPILEKHLDVYDNLSEFMEKIVFQLYSILKILNGDSINYKKAKKYKLSCNYNYLQRDRNFRLLIKPIDVLIRNSLAHHRRYYALEKKSIVFRDIINERRWKKLTFRKFVDLTRELFCCAFVSCYMEMFISLEKLKNFKKDLNKIS